MLIMSPSLHEAMTIAIGRAYQACAKMYDQEPDSSRSYKSVSIGQTIAAS
jgi:hypothetical protein